MTKPSMDLILAALHASYVAHLPVDEYEAREVAMDVMAQNGDWLDDLPLSQCQSVGIEYGRAARSMWLEMRQPRAPQ